MQNQNKFLNEFIIEQRRAFEATVKSLNNKIDNLYTEINKANQRIYELEEENKELKIILVQKDKESELYSKRVPNM